MNVLLLGAEGSIGSRYAAILKHLRIKFTPLEARDSLEAIPCNGTPVTHALVATPTETHIELCNQLLDMGLPFLCEKPLSMDVKASDNLLRRIRRMKLLDECHVVNNYCYALARHSPKQLISYDYYKTGNGNDGTNWDCCQLIYYAKKNKITYTIDTDSPIWILRVDGKDMPYRDIEESYINMVSD